MQDDFMMGYKSWIVVSGLFWAAAGFSLLYKGLHLISQGALGPDGAYSLSASWFGGGERGATALVALGLLVGFIKGRFVLAKTVKRVCGRILSLSLPIRIGQVYSSSYVVLIGSMILLGMTLRFLPIPLDVRGVIDVAIGSALLNGSMFYFRAAQGIRTLNTK
jgi:hypothetical protein